MIEMTPSATMTMRDSALTAVGKTGRTMRRMPYAPSFSRMPARMTEPAVGAAVWASGSQVWNGQLGTLIAKATKKAQKARLDSRTLSANGCSRCGLDDVEGAGGEVDAEDGQQHEHRAGHRVEEELDRRVLRPVLRLAPDADQEVHRDEADLPEDVEEDQVERDEHAQHAHFEQQEEEEELPHPRS